MLKMTKNDTKKSSGTTPNDEPKESTAVVGTDSGGGEAAADSAGVAWDDEYYEQELCSLSLHDCLALGEVELGLQQSSNDEDRKPRAEEVHRRRGAR